MPAGSQRPRAVASTSWFGKSRRGASLHEDPGAPGSAGGSLLIGSVTVKLAVAKPMSPAPAILRSWSNDSGHTARASIQLVFRPSIATPNSFNTVRFSLFVNSSCEHFFDCFF